MAFHSKRDLENAIICAFQSNLGLLPEATLENTFYDDHCPCYVVNFSGLFRYTFMWSTPEFAFVIARANTARTASNLVWKNIAQALTPGEKEDGMEVEFVSADDGTSHNEDIDYKLHDRIELFITKAGFLD